jgi:hypothetical protein
MVASVKTAGGVALICRQHEDIPMIAAEISGPRSPSARLKWPASRFDVVWVFESPVGDGDWTYRQVCQRLLSGDSKRLHRMTGVDTRRCRH